MSGMWLQKCCYLYLEINIAVLVQNIDLKDVDESTVELEVIFCGLSDARVHLLEN